MMWTFLRDVLAVFAASIIGLVIAFLIWLFWLP